MVRMSSTFSTFEDKSWLMKNSKNIMLGAGVCVVIALLVYISVSKKAELYAPSPTTFLSRDETKHFLLSDPDGYGRSLNPANLEACGVASHADLLDKWSSSATSFTPEDVKKLQDAALLSDYQIYKELSDPLASQLRTIGWKFAKTVHPYYLDGLPHTRADVIFLTDKTLTTSSTTRLASILVHEKVHVWQRQHPEEMQGWIDKKNYRQVKRILEDGLQRANPDVDDWLYEDGTTVFGVRYNTAQPHSLSDIMGYGKDVDHPYEQFAYSIQTQLFPSV